MRQLTQQRQVLVGAGGNADRHIGDLAVAPGDALRELENLHAGFQHLIAGVGGAVRNGDAIAEIGGGLQLARQHAVHVTGADAARFGQGGGHLADGLLLTVGSGAQMNVLR